MKLLTSYLNMMIVIDAISIPNALTN